MANYWIKAYVEIIDDPKMATLPDRLWRRVMELFLLAGKFHGDGNLPETKQLAWVLRMTTDDLDLDLKQIERTGIIQRTNTGWLVVNFEKRQAASTEAERKRYERNRRHAKQYEDVTNSSRSVTQITDNRLTDNRLTDTDTDTDKIVVVEERPNIFALYERTIGPLSVTITDHLLEAEKRYAQEWIEAAFEDTAKQNGRSWAYTKKILENWERHGFRADTRQKPKRKQYEPVALTKEEMGW